MEQRIPLLSTNNTACFGSPASTRKVLSSSSLRAAQPSQQLVKADTGLQQWRDMREAIKGFQVEEKSRGVNATQLLALHAMATRMKEQLNAHQLQAQSTQSFQFNKTALFTYHDKSSRENPEMDKYLRQCLASIEAKFSELNTAVATNRFGVLAVED